LPWILTIVVGDEEHLQDAEAAPGEVQEDVPNAPPHCAATPTVHPGLQALGSSGNILMVWKSL